MQEVNQVQAAVVSHSFLPALLWNTNLPKQKKRKWMHSSARPFPQKKPKHWKKLKYSSGIALTCFNFFTQVYLPICFQKVTRTQGAKLSGQRNFSLRWEYASCYGTIPVRREPKEKHTWRFMRNVKSKDAITSSRAPLPRNKKASPASCVAINIHRLNAR